MKKIYLILLCIGLAVGFLSCEKDKEFELTTLSISTKTITPSHTSATVCCVVTGNATVDNVYVHYSTKQDFAEYEEVKMVEEEGEYTAQLIGLQDNTLYYCRYAADNRFSSLIAEGVEQFQTLQATLPSVILDSLGTVWDTSAQAHIKLEFDGGANVTEVGVCWNTQMNPTHDNNRAKTADTVAILDLTSLQPNTTYYVRAYAVNKVGVAYSEEKVFTTFAVPEVKTEEVLDVQVYSAQLSATLVFNGNDSAVVKGFCWGVTEEPTIDGDYIEVNDTSIHYTYILSDLSPETQYYVRAYAQNKIGISYGEQVSFQTAKNVVLPSVTTAAATQVTESTATTGGDVISDGNATVTERGVVYATTANPTMENSKVIAGAGTGSYTCNLTGLQAGTTYYVRAYATNSQGTSYGEEITFTTALSTTLANVTTSAVTQITETTAVAGGNVTSDGNAEVTERGVVYSTVSNPVINNIYHTTVKSGSGTGSFSVNLTNLVEGTKYYVRAYATNSKGTSYGEQVSFTTNEQSSTPNNGTENGHEYVDLGLSVKWATCNVGASKPEEYGDYFAWGETEPKGVYYWNTYKWCNGSSSTMTKYNTNSSYGTVDNKTQLELSDDAARANWGGSWRMPTRAEQDELRENCTWTWTTQNGVNGYKVTSKKNGNSIFLPAAGYRGGSSLDDAGSYGYYRSSSLNAGYTYNAYALYFGSDLVTWTISYRSYGQSVRPVCQ